MPGVPSLVTFGPSAGPLNAGDLDANFSNVSALLASANNYNNPSADTGAANAYVATLPAGVTATLTAGLTLQFLAANANTGASTLNVNALGVKNIVNMNGTALTNAQIPAGAIVLVTYDGTRFIFLNAVPSYSFYTMSLGADVLLNNTANYFTGMHVAQGAVGTWFASCTVTLEDTAGGADFRVKMWDGVTVIASAATISKAASNPVTISLSGYLTSPAGDIAVSAKDVTATTGAILFNYSGESKDSTLTVVRIA